MDIKKNLQGTTGNSIKRVLTGKLHLRFEKNPYNYVPINVLGMISFLTDVIGLNTEDWTIGQDNNDLVFYYKNQERYRIEP